MKNILSLLLFVVCLAQCGVATGQEGDIVPPNSKGNGWILKSDSTLILTKDYEGECVYTDKVKRVVIEDGVTSTKNWKLGLVFEWNDLESISLPESLTDVSGLNYDDNGTRKLISVDTVYVPWKIPVAVERGVFRRSIRAHTDGDPLLIVPKGCIGAYRDSDWSRDFAYIGDEKGTYDWPIYLRNDWSLSYDEGNRLFVKKDFLWSNGPEVWNHGVVEHIELEEGVTEVGDFAFSESGCLVSSILLPQSLEVIGDRAFEYVGSCHSQLEMNFPEGLKYIGGYAFCNSSISSICIPKNLKYLGDCAFYYCTSLISVGFPETMTKIPRGAFAYCNKLGIETGELIIPSNVRVIGREAFVNCISLRHIVLPATVDTVGSRSFANITYEYSINVSKYVKAYDFRIDCYALDPPVVVGMESNAYILGDGGVEFKGDLYVPAESVEKYKASKWADEFDIYALDPEDNPYTAIKDVEGNKLNVSVRGGVISVEGVDEFDVLDISGRKMPSGRPLPAGVYLVTAGTGSEKVVVK